MLFTNKEEYKEWIDSQDWYQTIELKDDLKTHGKVPTNERVSFFDSIDFKSKSVLDIGCNSGQYCFFAEERGAKETLGVDIHPERIQQARILSENEGYAVDFKEAGIFDLDTTKQFDVVLCIAVLTEISDLFGAIEVIKKIARERAFIELDLAKPLIYASYSKNWLRGYKNLPRRTAIAEVRESKYGGWVISPSLDVLRASFGKEFTLKLRGDGVRYDMVEVVRK